jgi:hypothetical protein
MRKALVLCNKGERRPVSLHRLEDAYLSCAPKWFLQDQILNYN